MARGTSLYALLPRTVVNKKCTLSQAGQQKYVKKNKLLRDTPAPGTSAIAVVLTDGAGK